MSSLFIIIISLCPLFKEKSTTCKFRVPTISLASTTKKIVDLCLILSKSFSKKFETDFA